jgi:hypothetical protein
MTISFPKKQDQALADAPPGPRMLALREKTSPNLIWRFYLGPKHCWKWQHLSVRGEVILESAKAYKKYEECVANAKDHGYVFQPSQPRKPTATPA